MRIVSSTNTFPADQPLRSFGWFPTTLTPVLPKGEKKPFY
jgi:hypothetical protein